MNELDRSRRSGSSRMCCDAARRGRFADLRFIAGTAPRVDDWVARGDLRADLGRDARRRPDRAAAACVSAPKTSRCSPRTSSRKRADATASHRRRSRGRALTLLAALPWPGNTAELRALTERLAVLITRGVVLLEDVLANVRLEGAEALGGPSGTLREARERFERDYVAAVLQHHRGRMGDAARELGIERTNLYRKIKQLNIRWTAGCRLVFFRLRHACDTASRAELPRI